MIKYSILFLFILPFSPTLSAQSADAVLEEKKEKAKENTVPKNKMAWFKDAKLGIFIHWGIYAVNGLDESWSFFNGYISHEDYLKQLNGFTAEKYNPSDWASLIKESGARYSIITSKHHDGVALWDTKFSDLKIPKKTPAAKDVLSPFIEALRKEKLKVGIYFSLPDWSYADYTHHTNTIKRYEQDSVRWAKFLNYYQGQLHELQTQYNPDIWWFDGDWEHSAAEWEAEKVKAKLYDANPNTIINSRLGGHGDYATPEQGVPINRPSDEYWELCMTMNESWGYQGTDLQYKSPLQIIRIFADVISNGGNLLLDIGPKADGSIPKEQAHILKELGKWTKKHQEAIFGTEAGIPLEYFYGPTTLSKSKKELYLFIPGKPNGQIIIKGLKNPINRIRVVGNGTKLNHKILGKQYWSTVPGIVYIDVPDTVLDEYMTVIAVQLKGEVDLHGN